MTDGLKETLRQIRCASIDYDKREDGVVSFEYGDLWELYQYIKKLEENNKQVEENNISMQQELCRVWNKLDKVKNEIKKHLDAKNYSNKKYEFFGREYLEEILKECE